jgi:UDP-N-acetylglucosamine 2-epimerase (non-hydrolysing)
MKVCIFVGTRPEIIKMSPVINYCERKGIEHFLVHTGQHYSYEMDQVFFEELELKKPKYNLNVGSGTPNGQIGMMLIKLEEILFEEDPSVVLFEGDTNTALVGALAASKSGKKSGHVEAGLRSFDRTMPEEVNRIVADHVSDYLFPPTEISKKNLLREGIGEEKIFVTGNTVVDAVQQYVGKTNAVVLKELGVEKNNYFLVTAHRPGNVDNAEGLKKMFKGFELVHARHALPFVYPVHPRTRNNIHKFGLRIPDFVKATEPLGFLEFLSLMQNARLVLTDSGTVQEETCILRVPCVTLRENTERPEGIPIGQNILVGTDPQKIEKGVEEMLSRKRDWKNPFGDGHAAEKIIDKCVELLE